MNRLSKYFKICDIRKNIIVQQKNTYYTHCLHVSFAKVLFLNLSVDLFSSDLAAPAALSTASFLGRCPALEQRCALSDTLIDTTLNQLESAIASVSRFGASDWLLWAGPTNRKLWCCQPGRHKSWRKETGRIDGNKPQNHINKGLLPENDPVGDEVDQEKV